MAEVITGEAVVIDVPCARFPSRMLAVAVDIAVQLVVLAVLLGVAFAAVGSHGLDPAAGAAVSLSALVLVIVGYPAIFETLSRGRSLGKLMMGLRVVSDDGGPERFRQALMRALTAVLEIWLTLGFLALVTSLLSGQGQAARRHLRRDLRDRRAAAAAARPARPDVGPGPRAGRLGGHPGAVRAGGRDGGDRPAVP